MNEEQIQYDIFFEGSKDQLFAMLYPLTGPQSPIFNHLECTKIQYNEADKNLQFAYKTKDFSNIDKQNEQIIYHSTALPTHSNYFYSTFVENYNAFVWRSVNRMIQLRPGKVNKPQPANTKQKQNKKIGQKQNQKALQQMQQEVSGEERTRQLNLIKLQDEQNQITKQIESVPQAKKINRNWDISKQEYISRLCE